MRPADLHLAVARATGESVATVRRLGFLLADPELSLDADDEQLGPSALDWDVLDEARYGRQPRECPCAS